MLLSQNTLPHPLLDPVYRYELLLMETPLDTRSADENDIPRTCAVFPVSTPPPPYLPPRSPQAVTFCPPKWHQIPQTPYSWNQWDFTELGSTLFQANGFPGVSMGDALRQTFTALEGRDDLMFQDAGKAILFRLWVRLSCQFYFYLAKELTSSLSSPATR